jgi:excisionase family DNA binding protein
LFWSSQISTLPRNKDHSPRGDNLPRLKQVAFELGIGRSALYELIAAGKLKTVKVGRRRLVPREAIEEFIAGLSG